MTERGDYMLNIKSVEYEYKIYHFVVDKVSELDFLPKIGVKGQNNLSSVLSCNVGSTAFVTETSDSYVLNGEQNKWIKMTASSGGGGGDLPSGYEIASDTEVKNIFS